MELHNLYCPPSAIRIIKSRRIKWAGHVARMGRRGMHIGFWWESQKERDPLLSSGVKGDDLVYLGPLERASFYHWPH
jgi:hypothetical protein